MDEFQVAGDMNGKVRELDPNLSMGAHTCAHLIVQINE
jgi:hypothetical protein